MRPSSRAAYSKRQLSQISQHTNHSGNETLFLKEIAIFLVAFLSAFARRQKAEAIFNQPCMYLISLPPTSTIRLLFKTKSHKQIKTTRYRGAEYKISA